MTTGDIKHVGNYIISAAIGAFILYWFFWPEFTTKTEIVEVRTSDTVYITVRDTIKIREIKHTFLRDTIIQDFKPEIRLFKTSKPFLYGNVYLSLSGEVLGTVLKMDITQDFKYPQITNTITRTETTTITEKPKGLYLGLGMNSNLTPFGSVNYLDKQFIFSGSYSLDRSISVGIAKKLF